jgi:hypothetical protein
MKKNGNTNGNAKLTPQQVQQIRDAAAIGYGQRALAAHFRLSQATVSNICAGRLWATLPNEPASVLRPMRLELVDPVMRGSHGMWGGPTGVVEIEPETEAEPTAANTDTDTDEPPRAA